VPDIFLTFGLFVCLFIFPNNFVCAITILSFSHADGYLPLHWAVNQDYPNIDVIAALIAANASASAKACNKGSLPLHWCVNRYVLNTNTNQIVSIW
jgi:ankyrin repeat protein